MTFKKVSLKPSMDELEIAYTIDLLSRLTESIEIYLEDDRWDGVEAMYQEIKDANKLVRKYYKRLKTEHAKQEEIATLNLWNT